MLSERHEQSGYSVPDSVVRYEELLDADHRAEVEADRVDWGLVRESKRRREREKAALLDESWRWAS